MKKIKLPYEYKDYFGNTYAILRWGFAYFRDRRLTVRDPGGNKWLLSREDTVGLLRCLNLQEEQID